METLLVRPTKVQEKAVLAFLEALKVPFEKKQEDLPPHVLEGIKKGQEDVKAGRTLTLEEFKRTFLKNKNTSQLRFNYNENNFYKCQKSKSR